MVPITKRWSALIYFRSLVRVHPLFGRIAHPTQTTWLLYKWRFTILKEVEKMDSGKEATRYLYNHPQHFTDEKELFRAARWKETIYSMTKCMWQEINVNCMKPGRWQGFSNNEKMQISSIQLSF
uniref:Uncharacterized protein n=1 Tax=Molossus molossus TaxID=27622 RepID=A0A7J8DBV3_MOLMO|nr:hypothetical protein HJG59_009340 [Molossus molossus]